MFCINKDQTWFFNAVTFARSLGRCWKPWPLALVFNTSLGTWWMLMHEKPCLIPILKHILHLTLTFVPTNKAKMRPTHTHDFIDTTCRPFDITRKDIFCLAFYFKWKYFVLVDHILSETICLFCLGVLSIYSKIKFTAIIWSDLCNFYSEVTFWNFCLRKYFFLFFAEFELFMFHNNIVEISVKMEHKLVENLTPSYLPYRFLHYLHSFLLWENVKIFDFLITND